MIIDTHSHYMPPEVAQNTTFFRVAWSDLDRQLLSMDNVGTEKSLLLYPTSDAHIKMGGWKNLCEAYNRGLSSAVKKHPDRFIGGGILPMDDADAMLEELKKIKELGLKFISIGSSFEGKFLDDEKYHRFFEYAEKNNLPVHVHPQIINPIGEDRVRDPLLSPVLEYVFDVSMCIGKLMMEGIFLKFPKLKFIFAHYGGVLPIVTERFDNTYLMLRKREFVKDLKQLPSNYFKNLFFDTSGSKSLASFLLALEVIDSCHLLWGSDYPANQNISASLDVIRNSSLIKAEKDNILFRNMLGILSTD